MAFSHVQGTGHAQTTTVTSFSVTLSSTPSRGNIVVAAVLLDSGGTITGLTVSDSNSNSYTATPTSPLAHGSGGQVAIFYLLSAPSNATATITASWSGFSDTGAMWVDEFSLGGLTAVFDKDKGATNTFAGTTINLPSLTTAGSGELLYASAFPGNTLTAPTAGSTLGIWTGAGFGVDTTDTGGGSEYLLSGSGAVTPNFTDAGTGDTVSVLIAAFTIAEFGDDTFVQPQPPPFDPIVSVW